MLSLLFNAFCLDFICHFFQFLSSYIFFNFFSDVFPTFQIFFIDICVQFLCLFVLYISLFEKNVPNL